jgi:hypothetical protein
LHIARAELERLNGRLTDVIKISNMQAVRREAMSHLLALADEADRAAAETVAFGHTDLHPEVDGAQLQDGVVGRPRRTKPGQHPWTGETLRARGVEARQHNHQRPGSGVPALASSDPVRTAVRLILTAALMWAAGRRLRPPPAR